MATNVRLRETSNRIITSLLLSALEECREGDLYLCNIFGLSIDMMQKLDKLKADQISHISCNYTRSSQLNELLNIDKDKMRKIIELEAKEAKRNEMIDNFLQLGACKLMMGELFGLRSTQVANRKRFLNIKTVKGRLRVSTMEEQQLIFDCWCSQKDIFDYRERLLNVAKKTNLPLSKIYREVQIIEQVQNERLSIANA